MAISLSQAVLIALFVETLLYGIALTMGSAAMLVLLGVGSGRRVVQKYLIFVLTFMLMVATSHIVLSFVRANQAFVIFSLDNPNKSLSKISDPVLNSKNIVFAIQSILGDGTNVWRCYVIYGRKLKPIIIPSTIMLAGLGCGCQVINAFAHSRSDQSVFDLPKNWIRAYYALTIAVNVYCTVVVSWKIYRTTRFRSGGGSTHYAVVAIAETGILYTSSLILFTGIYAANSNLQFVAIDLITPLVPCLFCLVVLQVRFHRSSASVPSVYAIPTLPPVFTEETHPWTRTWCMRGRTPSISSSRPVQIQISRREEFYPGGESLDIQKKAESSVENTDEQ